jgi:urease accessory protein
MSTVKRVIVVTAGWITLASPAAFAHPMRGVGDFYAGMLHPVATLETVLPIVALSLFAGQQRRESAIHLLVAFPLTLIVGALLATYSNAPLSLGIVQLIFTALFGVLVALQLRVPVWLLVGPGALLGIAVGWTNASDTIGQVSPYRFVAGLAVAGLLLLVYGIGLVRNLTVDWTRIAVRVVGSWIAAVSILVVGLS